MAVNWSKFMMISSKNFLMVKIHDIKNYDGEGVPVDIYERGALPYGNAPLEMRNNYYLTNTLADVVPTLTT